MSGGSTFDKYIKMSWQMIHMEIILACFIIGMMVSMAEFVGPVAILFLVGAFAAMVSAAKKTFFTNLYGNGAVTFQSLPVSAEEMVLAKVTVMTGSGLALLAVIAVVNVFQKVAAGNFSFPDYMARQTGLEFLNEFHIPYIVVEEIAGTITGQMRMWFVLFAVIVWYNSRPESKKNGLLKIEAAAGFMAAQWILAQIGVLMTKMSGESYWLPAEFAMIVVNVVASAGFYKYIVNRVSRHYELG